ncbi:transposase [Streptomyces sp. NPDC093149]|uniref:transposase n=1 Tax=Streptomyces sp. NPDC093149 TaxID=3366031 RepID=UPI0038127188
MRVNHTYGRGGALAYLAAYDVHHAKVFGRCEPRTGIDPFMNLVAQVMTQEPYASAKLVFWIVDNGSSHRGKRAAERLTAALPNAVMVDTPVHASWLNQVEIYFSVVQRKVVSPNDFTDLTEVGDRLQAFGYRYNAAAQPFQWKFTTPTWTICWPGLTGTPPTPGRILRRSGSVINPRRTSGTNHLAEESGASRRLGRSWQPQSLVISPPFILLTRRIT